ncbi:MAG TPA: EscU/YscU/HrcU family type III secretion system export apparatus switch protein [Acidobacteriaceae bacterium]|jgi:flagellar biosynthetic protein FlhB|nr:EscU/YscU/HrcU family type III secretion system export apparatus switch protein [Acidobacteriaceae bacterium]
MPGDRTEQATAHHRQQAAEKGDRARSRDLMAAAAMLGGVFALGSAAGKWIGAWAAAYRACMALGEPGFWERSTPEQAAVALRGVVLHCLSPLGIVFAASLAAALLAGVAQGGGWTLQADALSPKLERLNPAENLKNVFSLRGAVRLGKSLVPVVALGFCAEHAIAAQSALPPLSVERYPDTFAWLYTLLLDGAWIFLGWAGIDYVMEWRSREGRLRMSKQELRDEFKETEGSPQVKARIRGLRRQMRRRQMKADMARATVVITNPTHYAVALSFDFETMEPPRVVAKGRDLLAAQIREEAQWAGVPMVENPPLARSLYRQVETGQTIPYELYAAVAAILAWLYRRQVEERLRREQAEAADRRRTTKRPKAAGATS